MLPPYLQKKGENKEHLVRSRIKNIVRLFSYRFGLSCRSVLAQLHLISRKRISLDGASDRGPTLDTETVGRYALAPHAILFRVNWDRVIVVTGPFNSLNT